SSAEETRDLSSYLETTVVIALPTISTDPVDELVERVRSRVSRAVDSLQVAAFLESEGLSDRIARVEYGYADIFRLADEVYRRLGPCEPTPWPAEAIRPDRMRALRDVLHGSLYLLPAAVFPAVLTVVGRRSLVLGLILAGGLAWMLAGGASWLAYRLLGAGRPGDAARVLRWSALGGLPLAAALGLSVVLVTGDAPWLIAVAAGQLAYQMASTLLMFYQRELLLAPIMAPAVAVGIGYLFLGSQLRTLAIALAGTATVAALALGLRQTLPGGRQQQRPMPRQVLVSELRTLPLVVLYAAGSAAFLLHAQVPYLLDRIDIAVTVLPLIVGMGFVEWRARRFGERARFWLRRVRLPSQFVRRVWWALAVETLACAAVVAALAGPLLLALARWRGPLDPASAAMAGAYAVLAGAYFLAFLLAERSRYGWLCGGLGCAIAAHLVATWIYPAMDPLWYLGSAVLLQVIFIAGLAPVLGQVQRYR
ncbi:MAG: hypothetical protein HKP61_15370, partial [Dactylosporangium sp.]|nr:hypothetical protein [Dactylosporangium sp.]NNJ62288.1 hypothetical protein [Dactylosporangium sp.]